MDCHGPHNVRRQPKIVLFAATAKGAAVLGPIVKRDRNALVAVVSFRERHTQGDAYEEIRQTCRREGVDFLDWDQVKADIHGFLEKTAASEAIAVGWRYLLRPDCLRDLNHPLIVFHDSLLPKYRGFAPTATAILRGDTVIGMSVLLASDGIDDGAIIIQRSAGIGPDTYISEALRIQAGLYAEAMGELLDLLAEGCVFAIPQDEREATYSIWRNPDDARIDWAQPAVHIQRKIRASGDPYDGAYTFLDGARVYIVRAELAPDVPFAIRDSGKIWRLETDGVLVVCGTGMLKITHAVDECGTMIRFAHLRARFS